MKMLNSRTLPQPHPGMPGWIPALLLAIGTILTSATLMAEQMFEIPTGDFVAEAFSGQPPEPSVLWLAGEIRTEVMTLLGHNYASLRVRYWRRGQRTVWVLEEIGKEHPITAGFIVDGMRLNSVRVLAFRETRGGEIRFDSFTRQFESAGLDAARKLDTPIDGISGATLSVNAMRKLAAMALLLTHHVRAKAG